MPINPEAVGLSGEPSRRSWNSKDALLYALGVGAGVDELAFTTENTTETPQRVLPTMAVVLGGGLTFAANLIEATDKSLVESMLPFVLGMLIVWPWNSRSTDADSTAATKDAV